MKINHISPGLHNYTQIITHIALVPKKLYYIGTLPTGRLPSVAVVGTRRPTRYGIEVTAQITADLARRGVVIISGLALGVDAIAHRAALDAGGTTIAIQANGLSKIRPFTNRQLGEDILAHGGAIMSEYEPDEPPYASRFLERNRIVSGLSDAVLITEASARSGTLSTANRALEQGKDVFVVPGNITSPQSAGCNALLKQGAHPVTSATDILQVIAPHLLGEQAQLALGDNPLQARIIDFIQKGMRDGDEIQRLTEAAADDFATELTMMELNGQIRALGGNQWALK